MRKTILFTLLSLIFGEAALAGALSISNVELATVNRKSAAIRLDLSWQCAWRDEVNHDAVWLFAKYSLDDGETWRHATLRGSGVTSLFPKTARAHTSATKSRASGRPRRRGCVSSGTSTRMVCRRTPVHASGYSALRWSTFPRGRSL